METAFSLSSSLLSLLLTCQDDRRGVGRLWGELLGGGRVVAGRGRGGRLIRNLGARAEVARVPAPQFTADVHRVVLQVRISIYRTIFRSPPLLSFARALRKMQREREEKRRAYLRVTRGVVRRTDVRPDHVGRHRGVHLKKRKEKEGGGEFDCSNKVSGF